MVSNLKHVKPQLYQANFMKVSNGTCFKIVKQEHPKGIRIVNVI